MKYYLPIIAMAISLFLSSCGASKELTAETAAAKSSLQQCQNELSAVQQELAQAKAMLGGSGDQLTQIQAENESLRSQLATVTQQMQESSDDYGIWFRVQIGAYEDRRIDNKLETTDQLSLETRNELQKIALGRFRIYEDAKKLQTQLQAMGLKDAWVVSYKDGLRISIEEALRN